MPTTDADRVLDVREIDGPPFDDIMDALDDLPQDDRLALLAPFEPVPLYEVLEARALTYETTEPEDGLYRVLIEHR